MAYKDPTSEKAKLAARRATSAWRARNRSIDPKTKYAGVDFAGITVLTSMPIPGIKTCMRRWRAPTLSPYCFWLWHCSVLAAQRQKNVAANRERYQRNPGVYGERKRMAYLRDPEKFRQRTLANYQKDKAAWKARQRLYYERNREKIIVRTSAYQKRTRAKIRAWVNERRRTSIQARLTWILGTRIRRTLKLLNITKRNRTHELIGCSVEEFRKHLESTFTEGMSWERFFAGEVHIDHRRPCASYDLSDIKQQKLCYHWTNLQALWKVDNLRKHARLDWKPPTGMAGATVEAVAPG